MYKNFFLRCNRLENKQRSDVQLSERIASPGVMGDRIKNHLATHTTSQRYGIEGFRGRSFKGSPLCREPQVSRGNINPRRISIYIHIYIYICIYILDIEIHSNSNINGTGSFGHAILFRFCVARRKCKFDVLDLS